MTTGEAGMRNQALGLAHAVGGRVSELTIRLRALWRPFPGHLCPFPLWGLDPRFDVPAPPWPDLLITCGRLSTAVSIAIRRAAGGRTVTVHAQNPRCRLDAFDLVVALAHDAVAAPNVVVIETAMHHLSAAGLAEAATEWQPHFTRVPRPRLGVLLGGRAKHQFISTDIADRLADDLEHLHETAGAGILLTPSRRTDARIVEQLAKRLAGFPWVHFWNGGGANPYQGILAAADGLLVTADSVSMISEALWTGKPVALIPVAGQSRHREQFVAGLHAKGAAPFFSGSFPEPQRVTFPDATAIAAERINALLQARIA